MARRYERVIGMAKSEDPYPVFKGGTAAEMAGKQRRGGGGGGFGVLIGVAIGVVAILGLGFAAIAVHSCNESSEHDASEARQREDAVCAKDPWGSQCPAAARERLQQRQADHVCDEAAKKRQAWIDAPSEEMDGHSPALFHMSSVGLCGTTLRVREDDCSLTSLGEAYGNKPFMHTASNLGFRKVSCGHDEYELSAVREAGR